MRIIRIGLDTSKHVFQMHGVDENEQAVLRQQIRRREVETFGAIAGNSARGRLLRGVTDEGFSGVALWVHCR